MARDVDDEQMVPGLLWLPVEVALTAWDIAALVMDFARKPEGRHG